MSLLAGRYELGAQIGAGGSSRVHRAHDERLDRDVAVKLLDVATRDPSARERFLREALIGGQISHPNAVTVFDTGDDDGTLYIAMELVEGEDLARRLRRDGPVPPGEAIAIAEQVLGVLEVAHQQGVIHRDIKPSNILLDADGSARLADFGIARPFGELTSELTRTGQIIGTAKYVSPEQAAGEALTPATDLYSTGIVLYEMLTGVVPFDGDHAVAVALAHQQREVPSVRDRAPHVTPGLAAVVERSLRKDLDERYASAVAMRDALGRDDAATAVLPAGAPAPGAIDVPDRSPCRPWYRRRPWLWAGFLAVVAMVGLWAVAGDRTPPPEEAGTGTGSDTTSAAAPTTSEPPPTTASPPVTSAPATLGELADRLAADPDAYGEKGSDLLDKLQEVQREKPEKRPEKATKLLEEIDKWVDEGKLDRVIADEAVTVLRPIADS